MDMQRTFPINGRSQERHARTVRTDENGLSMPHHDAHRRVAARMANHRSCFQCALRRSCFPGNLNDEIFGEIDRIAVARGPVARGETIFSTGDPFRCVYTVRSGALRTSMIDRTGAEQVIGFTLPGEIVGIESLGREQHCTRAVALERTTMCAIPVDRLLRVAQSHPGLQRRVHEIAGDMIRRDHAHFRELGRLNAHQRLLLFLADLLTRYRVAGFATDEVHLPMYREDIANYLGVALETISRMMTRLAEEGVIEVRHRHIRIIEAGVTALTGQPANTDSTARGY
ncbi:cyclic nucleotide-binding domain-containing protein [Halofilum ochraceum]|uniref:cyclic nucleotide-binding domain-containing protein n=1 Tax=Halofilum ochraceum TaxID=1611323 RepID=UPI0008DABD37